MQGKKRKPEQNTEPFGHSTDEAEIKPVTVPVPPTFPTSAKGKKRSKPQSSNYKDIRFTKDYWDAIASKLDRISSSKAASSTPQLSVHLPPLDHYLSELSQNLPDDYAGRSAALAEISHTVRRHLAAQLAPALNAEIQAMPHGTHEEKKEVARWVNDELEKFGLAVKCPNTGKPAKLIGDKGDYLGGGRFQYLTETGDGKRKATASTKDLPVLELIDATPAASPELEGWQGTVGPRGSRTPRKR